MEKIEQQLKTANISTPIKYLFSTKSTNIVAKQSSNEAIIIADDEATFVEKIKALLNNKNQIDNISQAGLEFVKNNYSWEYYVKPLEECFLAKN